MLERANAFSRLAQLGRVRLGHTRLDAVFDIRDLEPALQARLGDTEVFRAPADRGFAPTRDRDDIVPELLGNALGTLTILP